MKTQPVSHYRRPFVLAVTVHVALLLFLLFRWQFNETAKVSSASTEIVQATLMTAPQPIETPKPAPVIEKPVELPSQKPAPVPEPKPLPQPIEPIKEELPKNPTESLPVLTTPEENKKKILAEKKKSEKKEAEKKVLEEKKLAQNQKRLQADLEQQLEQEKQEQKIKQSQQQQKEIEKLLQKDLASTSSTVAASKKPNSAKVTSSSSSIDNKEIDRYKGLIIAAISHRWIVPESVKKGLVCHLRVRIAPGGTVISVKQIKSSGDSALDRSAESAVYKASPLPVPKEAALFDTFREFNLVVKPEGILSE